MKDLQQHQTTSSGLKGNRGRYSLESPPPAAHISYKPSMVGKQYGWVKIVSAEKRWNQKWSRCYVLTKCTGCGAAQWQDLNSLQRGASRGCQSCSRPRRIPKWLDKRLTAAKQRCENPNDRGYRNYGARGIRFNFESVTAAGLYLIETYGLPERSTEIDRIDNMKDYEPGNLRYVTHKENNANKRTTVLSRFEQKYWPYAYSTTIRKLSSGMTREEIIKDAEDAVKAKRKCWRKIAERLASMTYEMPDSITVLPYQES